MFDSLISNLLTEHTSFTMPKIHNIQKQENQYEVTHVSPSCVRNGVLGVSIIQLRRGSDKKNLTEISTLTSEVVSSDEPYFFQWVTGSL